MLIYNHVLLSFFKMIHRVEIKLKATIACAAINFIKTILLASRSLGLFFEFRDIMSSANHIDVINAPLLLLAMNINQWVCIKK